LDKPVSLLDTARRVTKPGLPQRQVSIFFGEDRGMVFFLGFLVLTAIVLPAIRLSQLGWIVLSPTFALTLIFGSFATIRHRIFVYFVILLAISAVAVDVMTQFALRLGSPVVDSALKLCCLSILLSMTLKRTLRPGPVTVYRVMGGVAGYLIIGLTWALAYDILVQQVPDAIHFLPATARGLPGQPSQLIYFSFVTLTTVGYGDVYPAHPAARSLAVAEALVGQLYIAILISSLVGMALQTRPERNGNRPSP
jgi:Ion channel